MYGYKSCLEKERTALLEIKAFYINSTLESWVDDRVSNCCDWDYVECNTTTGRVINLSLSALLDYIFDCCNWNYVECNTTTDYSPPPLSQILNFSLFQPFEELQSLDLNLEFLDLSHNGISGTIQEIGLANLRNLEFLDLSHNGISGTIQELGLANLRNLKFLDLYGNGISGTLHEICELKNLIELDLKWNNFEGHLPTCLNNLINLRAVDLSSNQLNGNISFVIENLATSLEDNNFEGLFSFSSLANLSKLELFVLSTKNGTLQVLEAENFIQPPNQLKVLYLRNCNLHAIPSFIMYQHSLQFIDLSHNKLVGMFPTWLLRNNTRLQGMNLMNNSFTRIIQLPNLTHDLLQLKISKNNMNGQLPKNMGMILPRLSYLDLSNNSFEGHIPSSIGEMKGLNTLDLSSNNFSRELPKSFISGGVPVQLSNIKGLEFLDISKNRLSGSIASSINLSSVQHLYLQQNTLNGSISNAFFRSSTLVLLDMRDNKFSGNIPNQIDNGLSNLNFLLLVGNHLEGNIPHELCRLKNISILDLSRNKLNGSIPSCFTNMSSWLVESDKSILLPEEFHVPEIGSYIASYNFTLTFFLELDYFEGSYAKLEVDFVTKNRAESYEGSILQYMTGIDLSSNKLTGVVPSEFGYLQKIHAVNLSHNSLSGAILESFSHLKNMESLDLSYNKLSGRIPPQLTKLYNLSTFNVTFNNLSDPVPDQGQFGTFDESSYGGNPYLCGSQIKRNCSSEPIAPPATPSGAGEEEDESIIDMVSFYWSVFASCVTTILALQMTCCTCEIMSILHNLQFTNNISKRITKDKTKYS
ncbi:hypothetical protein ACOSQ4_013842 [Xanthoceras sorbifolium]